MISTSHNFSSVKKKKLRRRLLIFLFFFFIQHAMRQILTHANHKFWTSLLVNLILSYEYKFSLNGKTYRPW